MITADKDIKIENKTDSLKSVLVVEDDEGLNRLIQKSLIKAGFTVEGVYSGEDAVAHLMKYPDVLLMLDLVLPDMSGQEVIEEITRQRLDAPFAVMTGHGDEKTAVDMMKMGARDYLIKDAGFLERLVPTVERICKDITVENKLAHAEKLLKNATREWQTTFDAIKDAVCLLDLDSKIIRCNTAMQKLLGKPEEKIVGHIICQLMHGHSDPIADCPYQRSIKSKQKEHQILPFNDSFFDVTVYPVLDYNGILSGAVHIVSDITERKRMENALLESEEKYRSMMEAMQEAVYICSSDFCIEYMNPAMTKKIGSGAMGEICHQTIHGLDEKCPWCVHEKVMQLDYINLEVVSPKDEKTYQISNSPIIHIDGSVSKLAIYRDITEHKNMGALLQQAQKMESIGTLAGGIAHDFNNILGAIIGYTEMARDDSPHDSQVAKDLDKVLEASDRAADLVKQILAFSRQDDVENILLSPPVIVKKAIAMLRPTLPATIEITQDIDPETGFIFADPTQFHQILMNLCTNAFHGMEETGGKLEISLKEIDLSSEDLKHEPHIEAGTFIQLSVCDSGPGIPQELRDKIFDPYFTTKEVGKGTGLGLSIIHGIVKSYGGYITLYSQPGEGTTFHVFLPVVEKEVLPDYEAIQQIPLGIEKILFIDDEEILADMGKEILERLGYHVTVRKSSLEALETFRNQPDQFDLVITDQTMPGMTGVDLARRMLQIRPDIPIILCTGYSSVISEEKAKSIGIREFALKPVTKKNIAVLIRKVLDDNQKLS